MLRGANTLAGDCGSRTRQDLEVDVCGAGARMGNQSGRSYTPTARRAGTATSRLHLERGRKPLKR